jgi:hypothetical protein
MGRYLKQRSVYPPDKLDGHSFHLPPQGMIDSQRESTFLTTGAMLLNRVYFILRGLPIDIFGTFILYGSETYDA